MSTLIYPDFTDFSGAKVVTFALGNLYISSLHFGTMFLLITSFFFVTAAEETVFSEAEPIIHLGTREQAVKTRISRSDDS